MKDRILFAMGDDAENHAAPVVVYDLCCAVFRAPSLFFFSFLFKSLFSNSRGTKLGISSSAIRPPGWESLFLVIPFFVLYVYILV